MVPVNLEYRGPTLYEVIYPPPPQYDLTLIRKGKLLHRPELLIKFLKKKIIFKRINEWDQYVEDENFAESKLNHMSVVILNFLLYFG